MAKAKLIKVIDCAVCKQNNAARVYDNKYLFEIDCWECGYKTAFHPGLFDDDSAYDYYKELVSNNCMDLSVNSRLFMKVAFSIMATLRGDNMWDYIPKLPDVINVGLCPNCGGEISAKHYPWDAEYRVNCYACGFKTSIHEDTVFERVKENMSA
jgi:Zn ribbon nucleic-acid-binding protein